MASRKSPAQWAVTVLLIGLFLVTISPLLAPVALGLFIAVVCHPLQKKLIKKGMGPDLAALTVSLLVSLVVVLPLVFLGITVIQEAVKFVNSFDLEKDDLLNRYEFLLEYFPLGREAAQESMKSLIQAGGTRATALLTSLAASIPATLLGIVLFIVTFFYGLVDGKSLAKRIVEVLPLPAGQAQELAQTAEKISRGVVLGSLVAGVVQGCIMGLAFVVLGVPKALLFGTVTAILSFAPALGSGPVGIGGAIYLWSNDHGGRAIGMLIFLAVAATSDNIVKPWMLKGQTELHPLLGLLGAIGGLAVFGFAGLFLGPLFAALAAAILHVMHDGEPA